MTGHRDKSGPTSSCAALSYLHALPWLQGLAMGVQTAMEVSDWHQAAGVQKSTAREGLALSTHSCGRSKSSKLAASQGPSLQQGGGWRGTQQLASVDANICWAKTGEICRGFAVAVLAFGLFSGKILWGLLQSRSLEISVAPTV